MNLEFPCGHNHSNVDLCLLILPLLDPHISLLAKTVIVLLHVLLLVLLLAVPVVVSLVQVGLLPAGRRIIDNGLFVR